MFNAGCGAVFTHKGNHQMDASIMEGKHLEAGAVSGVSRIKNPIQLARVIKEKSGHVYLCGEEAEAFAQTCGFRFEPNDYFYTEERYQQWLAVKDTDTYQLDHTEKLEKGEKKFGTVGAVALDMQGNLAAATSTGGMTNKRFGRIGDTPIIGAGTYANNETCAISCTGHGEFFIRAVVAYDISCLMQYKGLTLAEACQFVVNDKLVKMGGEGGLIAIDAQGNIQLPFNSDGMYRAWSHADGLVQTAIYKN
jgi:beta-aspartyl-peptidase (threonine type)